MVAGREHFLQAVFHLLLILNMGHCNGCKPDNGIHGMGMSKEFVEHIFEPFERETSVTQSGIQGTGLGMAITKNIVEMFRIFLAVSTPLSSGICQSII